MSRACFGIGDESEVSLDSSVRGVEDIQYLLLRDTTRFVNINLA